MLRDILDLELQGEIFMYQECLSLLQLFMPALARPDSEAYGTKALFHPLSKVAKQLAISQQDQLA